MKEQSSGSDDPHSLEKPEPCDGPSAKQQLLSGAGLSL